MLNFNFSQKKEEYDLKQLQLREFTSIIKLNPEEFKYKFQKLLNIKRDFFRNYFQFKLIDQSPESLEIYNKIQYRKCSQQESKIFSMFLNTCVGDQIGNYYKTHEQRDSFDPNIKENFQKIQQNFHKLLKSKSSYQSCSQNNYYFTNTIVLILERCYIESLIANKGIVSKDDILKRLQLTSKLSYLKLQHDTYNFDLGQSIAQSLDDYFLLADKKNIDKNKIKNQENQFNTGAGSQPLVNVASLVILYQHDYETLKEEVQKMHDITQSGEESREACVLFAYILYHLLNAKVNDKKDAIFNHKIKEFSSKLPIIQSFIKSECLYVDGFRVDQYNYNWKAQKIDEDVIKQQDEKHVIGQYCMEMLYLAFHIVYNSNNTVEAMERVPMAGQTSCRLGVLVGQLCGALYGFDQSIFQHYQDFCFYFDSYQNLYYALQLMNLSKEIQKNCGIFMDKQSKIQSILKKNNDILNITDSYYLQKDNSLYQSKQEKQQIINSAKNPNQIKQGCEVNHTPNDNDHINKNNDAILNEKTEIDDDQISSINKINKTGQKYNVSSYFNQGFSFLNQFQEKNIGLNKSKKTIEGRENIQDQTKFQLQEYRKQQEKQRQSFKQINEVYEQILKQKDENFFMEIFKAKHSQHFESEFYIQGDYFSYINRYLISENEQIVQKILELFGKINQKVSLNLEENKLSKSLAMVMGSLLGDALGTHTEFFNFNAKKQDINQNWDSLIQFIQHNLKMGFIKKQRTEFGVHSDDFSMAKCVADSFIENDYNFDPVDMRKRFVLWWYFGLNNGYEGNRSFGLGREINQGFQKIVNQGKVNKYVIDEGKLEQMTDVSGNGSVMRLAYIPILYREELIKGVFFAKQHSLTTHTGNEAYDLCGLLTFLCINLLQYSGNNPQRDIFTTKLKQYKTQIPSIKAFANSQKESFNSLKNYNIQFNQNELDRYWDWKDEKLVVSQTRLNIDATYYGSYSMDSAYLAMHASYHSKSQVEAIFRAVNFKGDSDSVASIVGYITGAMYGLSPEIIQLYNDKCLQYDQFQSLIRAYMIHYKIKNNK